MLSPTDLHYYTLVSLEPPRHPLNVHAIQSSCKSDQNHCFLRPSKRALGYRKVKKPLPRSNVVTRERSTLVNIDHDEHECNSTVRTLKRKINHQGTSQQSQCLSRGTGLHMYCMPYATSKDATRSTAMPVLCPPRRSFCTAVMHTDSVCQCCITWTFVPNATTDHAKLDPAVTIQQHATQT